MRNCFKKINQKAPGKSGITKKHLTELPINMANNLNYIFNHSIAIGYFPEIFKQAVMIFLLKLNKSPYHHTNYRPISLLEVPAKFLKNIINRRLLTLIEPV